MYFDCSAKDGTNINKVFMTIASNLLNKDNPTDLEPKKDQKNE